MRVLNKIIQVHPRQGITIEPDLKHAETNQTLGWGFKQGCDDTDDKRQVKESLETITNDVHEKAKHEKLKGDDNGVNNPEKLNDTQATRYHSLVAKLWTVVIAFL